MVVVIIGILIAIAIPLYLNYQRGANDKSAHSDVRDAIAMLEHLQDRQHDVSDRARHGDRPTYNALTAMHRAAGQLHQRTPR